ncbi:hypothetical protein CHS0354_022123 [Potamilus streckersoni]|uniref:Uncharacterized protein n=1 Tax=Potamilus streckersoni TaxID=2493646 RepID=A0AAE0RT20_9BIVA|nr:hypothetical protein CHS0354_022123 [Potamilus streckersoni]
MGNLVISREVPRPRKIQKEDFIHRRQRRRNRIHIDRTEKQGLKHETEKMTEEQELKQETEKRTEEHGLKQETEKRTKEKRQTTGEEDMGDVDINVHEDNDEASVDIECENNATYDKAKDIHDEDTEH